MGSSVAKKVLIFRLSSMGDIVLATSALAAARNKFPQGEMHWVAASEFSEILEGAKGLKKVWKFQRSSGLKAWVNLCRKLWQENFDEVFDLHSSLRTSLARLLFFYWGLGSEEKPIWRGRISKERIRNFGVTKLKFIWPKRFYPTPFVKRFSKLIDGQVEFLPDLSHLKLKSDISFLRLLAGRPFLAIMPSSTWSSKEWPADKFVALIKKLNQNVVILGSQKDQNSRLVFEGLQKEKSDFMVLSAIGQLSLRDSIQVIGQANGFIGNDTGFFHVAEALRVPSLMVMGPTAPELGYGPSTQNGKSVGLDLFCRPCSKNGKYCYRFWQPRICMNNLTVEKISNAASHLTK